MDAATLQAIYRRQTRWFAGERNRLLRKIDIVSKGRVLDLGAGTGELLGELDRRTNGFAVGLDDDVAVLSLASGRRVTGKGDAMPFRDGAFDLVVAQMFFMWAQPLGDTLAEVGRVLGPGGHLIAVAEPDYGGAIDHPSQCGYLAELAESLSCQGADVRIGRKLGGALRRAGFHVECGVHPVRPLEAARRDSVFATPELGASPGDLEFVFMPYFHFLAVKPAG